MRRVWAGVCVAVTVTVGGCGGGEMSLTEYIDEVNAIVDPASEQYGELVASPHGEVLAGEGELADFSPQGLQTALDHLIEIEVEVQEALDAIEPPEQVADLHHLLFDFDDRFISVQVALGRQGGHRRGLGGAF